jgi:hypothetical protein
LSTPSGQDDDGLFAEFRIRAAGTARWDLRGPRQERVLPCAFVVGAITFVLHWIALYAPPSCTTALRVAGCDFQQ